MQAAIREPRELLDTLALAHTYLPAAERAAELFALRVPRGFVARMRHGDPSDPLLRQVLPLDAEHADVPGYHRDAVGDLPSRRGGGLLHKYHGRALLIATGACAVHCRYCFRRHFPYTGNQAGSWDAALARIGADTSLREIILSGGDPLSLNDRRLAQLVTGLERIRHVEHLRIHTRHPVVLPERVDDNLLAWLRGTRLRCVIVIHANHANEIDAEVAQALQRLRDAGAVLFNQSVLLRGVNDDAQALVALSERLFTVGVLPYYLHLLDPVAGAAHFDVPRARAQHLLQQAAARLPGYLVPRLAYEQPGAPSKQIIGF